MKIYTLLAFVPLALASVSALAQSPVAAGSGSYYREEDFDYEDFLNFPSKIIDQATYPNPTDFNLHQNLLGHYGPIGTDRTLRPITPKVSPTFNQNFQSPEWWSTHIWNFATNDESNNTFNDKYFLADTLNLAHIGKDWHAAYGSTTHPHPFAFDNRGYGFGIGTYNEGAYQDMRGDTSATPPIVNGVYTFNWNWTQVANYYDFAPELIVSIGGEAQEFLPNNYNLMGSKFVDEDVGTQVERYGDWTATINWPFTDGTQLSVTSGHGMPIVQCQRTGGPEDTINITSNYLTDIWYQDANCLALEVNKAGFTNYYAIFFPSGTTHRGGPGSGEQYFSHLFEGGPAWQDVEIIDGERVRTGYSYPDYNNDGIEDSLVRFNSAIRLTLPDGMEHFSIALLPDNDLGTLQEFKARAFAYVTDSRVSHNYDMASANMSVNFDLSTQLVPGAPAGSLNETVQCLYMHQYKHSTAGDPSTNYRSPRGAMRLHYGNGFECLYQHVGLLPNLGWANNADSVELYNLVDQVTNMCNLFYDANPYGTNPNSQCAAGFYGETYEHGVMLNKYADLLPIAKQVGHEEAFQMILDSMKVNLEDWFDASDAGEDGDRYKFFVYSERVNSMVGYPYGHWSAPNFNDHQLHWGYFIKAAAMIARYDQQWAQEWGPMVEMLIRDANSWMRDDPMFGYMRYFDPYAGHSWISGRAEGRTGLDIESSSESINFATAVALWGANTNQPEIRDWGLFISTVEYLGTQYYWWDKDDDVHSPNYPNRAVATIWGSTSNFELFFYGSPLMKYGINWLPMSGTSMYLGLDSNHMKILWEEMEAQEFAATRFEWNFDHSDPALQAINAAHRMKGWRSLAAQYRAMWDADWALDMIEQLESEYQGWELGPGALPYSKWNDSGAEYDVNTGWGGLSETMLKHWVHTFDSVGTVDQTAADWALTHVYIKDGCKHYMAYNPPNEAPRTVNFSDGRSFELEADTLMVWYPLGEPLVDLTTDTNLFCPGDQVHLFVTDSTDGGMDPTYQWFVNGDTIPGAYENDLFINSLQDGDTVFVVMTTSLDCYVYETDTSDAIIFEETEPLTPTISISSSVGPYCEGNPITLDAAVTNQGDTPMYEWFVDGQAQGVNADFFELTPAVDTISVFARLVSNASCLASDSAVSDTLRFTVEPYVSASLAISAIQDSVCPGADFSVRALHDFPGQSVQWYVNDLIQAPTGDSLLLNAPDEGTTIQAVLEISGLNCILGDQDTSGIREVAFKTEGVLSAEIEALSNPICLGDSFQVHVTSLSNAGIPTYYWYVNGQLQPDQDSLLLRTDLRDSDSIQLIVHSGLSCLEKSIDTTEVITVAVTAENLAEVVLSTDQQFYCQGDTVLLSADRLNHNDNLPRYFWELNGDRTSSTDSVWALPNILDGDVVRAGLGVSYQCFSDTVVWSEFRTIEVGDTLRPSLELTSSHDTLCTGEQAMVTLNYSPDTASVSWFRNGNSWQVSDDEVALLGAGEEEAIYVRLSLSGQCVFDGELTSDTVRMYPRVVNPPMVSITDPGRVYCEGDTFRSHLLSRIGDGAQRWSWFVNQEEMEMNRDSLSLTDFSSGDSVYVVLISDPGCVSPLVDTSNMVLIDLESTSSTSLSLEFDQEDYCEGDTVNLVLSYAQAGDSPSITWFENNMAIQVVGNELSLAEPIAGTTYFVELVPDVLCPSQLRTISDTLVIDLIPEEQSDAQLSAPAADFCGEQEVILTLDLTNAGENPTILWYENGEPFQAEGAVLPIWVSTGDNEFSVSIIPDVVCPAQPLIQDTVMLAVQEHITWSMVDSVVVPQAEEVLMELNSNAETWTWTKHYNLDDSSQEQPVVTTEETEWKYVLMSRGVCQAQDSIKIVVVEEIDIPNTFTPNDDAINDTWVIDGLDTYPWIQLRVYNRWGNLVYESVGSYRPWDGTNGEGASFPAATYYYILGTGTGEEPWHQGDVTIVR